MSASFTITIPLLLVYFICQGGGIVKINDQITSRLGFNLKFYKSIFMFYVFNFFFCSKIIRVCNGLWQFGF